MTNDSPREAAGRRTPVHPAERMARAIRALPGLRRLGFVWDAVRPAYDRLAARLYRGGVEWNINGTDRIVLLPRFRTISENHEPEAWRVIMDAVRPGDTVVDVGASTGMYTLAFARRVGPSGRVIAFEPDPRNFDVLRAHVALNGVEERVETVRAAVGSAPGTLSFSTGKGAFSHVTADPGADAVRVDSVPLDRALAGRKVDLLKIDVEGYEEEVLRGAVELLRDPARAPRFLYLELHYWAWERAGLATTKESVLRLLEECGYRATALDGRPAAEAEGIIDVVASRAGAPAARPALSQ